MYCLRGKYESLGFKNGQNEIFLIFIWQNQNFHHFGSLKFIEIGLSEFTEIAVLADFVMSNLADFAKWINEKGTKNLKIHHTSPQNT